MNKPINTASSMSSEMMEGPYLNSNSNINNNNYSSSNNSSSGNTNANNSINNSGLNSPHTNSIPSHYTNHNTYNNKSGQIATYRNVSNSYSSSNSHALSAAQSRVAMQHHNSMPAIRHMTVAAQQTNTSMSYQNGQLVSGSSNTNMMNAQQRTHANSHSPPIVVSSSSSSSTSSHFVPNGSQSPVLVGQKPPQQPLAIMGQQQFQADHQKQSTSSSSSSKTTTYKTTTRRTVQQHEQAASSSSYSSMQSPHLQLSPPRLVVTHASANNVAPNNSSMRSETSECVDIFKSIEVDSKYTVIKWKFYLYLIYYYVYNYFLRYLIILHVIPRSWFSPIYFDRERIVRTHSNIATSNHQRLITNNPKHSASLNTQRPYKELKTNYRYHYPDNEISNSKYTFFTFIPHNITNQFLTSNMNRYFLAIACLQLWRDVSPVDPLTTWTPLIIALLITATKALYDDLKRFYNDYKSNFKSFTIVNRKYLNTSSMNNTRQDDFLIKIKSKDIKVGDIIKLEENDEIPADCVLIQSATENGISYVTTANMDGEVDLKLKQAPRDLLPYAHDKFLLTCPMFVKCSQPNRDMYTFDSTMFLYDYTTYPNNIRSNNAEVEDRTSNHSISVSEAAKNSSNHLKIVSLNAEQLLCQSCHLKNVAFSYGLVVYTGNETKSGMNKSKAPNKKAQSDYKIDKMSIAIFVIQTIIAITGGVLGIMSNEKLLKGKSWYLAIVEGSILDPFVIMPVRFFLLTTYMIPISLKITIDFMKIIFSLFIEWDSTLYDPKKDWACIVSNSDICEDLGQVNYILSDKTGTLTENRMIFKKCSIFGQVYDFDDNGHDAIRSFIRSVKSLHSYQHNNDFYERYYLDDRSELRPFLVTQFFTALSLCHTCKREANEFKSVSPDEECLVKACQSVGIELFETAHDYYSLKYNLNDSNGSQNGSVTTSNIQYNTQINELNSARSGNKSARSYSYNHTNSGNISVSQIIPLIDSAIESEFSAEKFELLHVFKFTSDRKRMSVVVRDVHNDKVILYCKGADDMMLSLMKNDFCLSELNQTSKMQINEFSKTGLRTLLVGFKYLEPHEYKVFEDKLRVVSTLSEGRDAELSRLYNGIESNLTYLGITAIEDELQEQVPQTIKKIRQANINIWMLTGDKQETAQQIALSCQLIDGLNSLHEISGQSTANLNECLVNILRLVKTQENYSVIVNGFTLSLIMHPQHNKGGEQIDMALFEKILMNAKSVICCRVTPGQKADIVSLVINHDKRSIKRETDFFKRVLHTLNLMLFKRTVVALAIGDGQNDIPMIQKAHVGVGIAGNEGLQAAMSADFSVGKFRHIIPLLFKHGHLAYHRTSMISQFSFYKNVLLSLIQVLFNIFTGFSGMSIYNELSLALYNFVFTGIFIFTFVFDFSSRMDDLVSIPSLYQNCQKSKTLNPRTFATWIGLAILHAGIILTFSWLAFNDNNSFIKQSIDKDYMGHVLYSSVLWTSVFSFLTYSNSFNVINMGVIIVTMIGYYCYLGVYGNIAAFIGISSSLIKLIPGGKYTYGVFNQMMLDPINYLIVLLNTVACWVVILAVRGFTKLLDPSEVEKASSATSLFELITGSKIHSSTEIKVVKRNQIVNSR